MEEQSQRHRRTLEVSLLLQAELFFVKLLRDFRIERKSNQNRKNQSQKNLNEEKM